MVGWLVSRTTFSGHLRADLIRMIDLSMTIRLPNIAGGVGRHQSEINRRTTSALPTTVKYLAMGTTDDSRELSNRTQLNVAMLDRSHVARQIDLAGSFAPNSTSLTRSFAVGALSAFFDQDR
jgi:hypothetical protein